MVLVRLAVFVVLLYRRARYGYPFRRIPLTQGKYAIVDPQDYDRLRIHNWRLNGRRGFYAIRQSLVKEGGKNKKVWMHREILPVEEGFVVDHINHNTLDNRIANLRPATRTQNSYNCRKRKNTSSRYKGVHWYKYTKRWRAEIKIDGKNKSLGYFKSEADAGKAYDNAARKIQKDFAVPNFPKPPSWLKKWFTRCCLRLARRLSAVGG